jgi:hypothetical protein
VSGTINIICSSFYGIDYLQRTSLSCALSPQIPLKNHNECFCDLVPYKLLVTTRPTSEDNGGGPAGMRVLTGIPQEPLQVASFKLIKDGNGKKISVREHLNTVIGSLKTMHKPDSYVIREWNDFAEQFPSGTAEEYIKQPGNTYRIPFKSMFRPEPGTYTEGKPAVWARTTNKNLFDLNSMLKAEATACVQWGKPGETKVSEHPRVFPEFDSQGLCGGTLVPGNPEDYVSTSYEKLSAKAPRTELKKRKVSPIPSKKNDCVTLLQRLDAEAAQQPAVITGDDNHDSDSEFEINVGVEYEAEGEPEGDNDPAATGAPKKKQKGKKNAECPGSSSAVIADSAAGAGAPKKRQKGERIQNTQAAVAL